MEHPLVAVMAELEMFLQFLVQVLLMLVAVAEHVLMAVALLVRVVAVAEEMELLETQQEIMEQLILAVVVGALVNLVVHLLLLEVTAVQE
jgi:hypothetical protein